MNAPLNAAATLPAGDERRARPEAAVFGEWNTSNLGDRGIHDGVLRFFSECGWDARSYGLSTLTPVPADAANRPASAPVPGRVVGVLGRVPPLKRVLRGARQRVRIAALSPRLRHSQAIVVGGGALLSDANLHFPQSLVRLARAARRLGKPLVCLGCSVEGEWSAPGSRMIGEFLDACEVIAVRDHATAGRLAAVIGAPPPVFGDFCLWESRIMEGGGSPQERHSYAINVSQLPGPWAGAQEHYEDALVALISRLARRAQGRRAGIRIFTTGTAEDARAAQRVFGRIDAVGAELHLPGNLAQLSSMLRTSAVAVSTRLHAAILALAEQTPVVGFSAGPKLRNYFATLGIRRCAYDVADQAQLMDWLAQADYGELYSEQRRALVHSPIWADRARVRRSLELLAGAETTCR
ncbi:MAG TPA: polysaccharide pyruvyl transferase family protein [Steroidobacteraceae bacterium]|nr:polysaccharide pyruvyl transferase family protein [Steroidobacteraceae bacterium]